MEADWLIALAAEDPVLVVPWAASDDEEGERFVDLRQQPALLDTLAGGMLPAAVREALRLLNSAASAWWTAKCDRWISDDVPCDPYEMDADAGETACITGSYIDLLARDGEFCQSFARQEQWLRQVTEQLRLLDAKAARVELILRPAVVEGRPGFAVSWFVEGCGANLETAEWRWSRALTSSLAVILDSMPVETGQRYNGDTGE